MQQRGYQTQLITSASYAITALTATTFDLIILNLFDSVEDAIPVLKQLRGSTSVPILLLSHLKDESDLARAIEAGTDDCLVKPVGPRLFLAKVRVWLDRGGATYSEPTTAISVGDLQLNPDEQIVMVGTKRIKLTHLEFRVLNLLMNHAGQTLSKTLLVSRVWEYTDSDDGKLLKYVIHRLRRKIEPDPKHPCYIHSVRGEGYVFDPCT